MSLEAAFIGFVIPSQIIQSVRAVQAALYTSIIGHALPDPRASKYRNEMAKKKSYYFSASSYFFVSYYLAQQLKWLPESSMILSHVDPLPHIFYDMITRKAYTTFSRNGQEAAQNAQRVLSKQNHRNVGNT